MSLRSHLSLNNASGNLKDIRKPYSPQWALLLKFEAFDIYLSEEDVSKLKAHFNEPTPPCPTCGK